jgi:adenylate cyclase
MRELDIQLSPETRLDVANACEITLLFCDIAGLTRFTERLGDFVSYRVVKSCQARVAAISRRFGGDLLEVRGDGFLLAFDSPVAAARCAVAIQSGIAADPALPIRVRIGVHTGPAIRDAAGYYGRTVIAAFRVSSLAQADEILISDEVRGKLPSSMFGLGRSRDVRLKGFERRCRVWQLRWRDGQEASRPQVWSGGRILHIARAGSAEVASGAAGR